MLCCSDFRRKRGIYLLRWFFFIQTTFTKLWSLGELISWSLSGQPSVNTTVINWHDAWFCLKLLVLLSRSSNWIEAANWYLTYITRPNCALDRRTIFRLYVPGFQKLIFKHLPNCKWITLTKFPWIPCTNNCNVIFVSTFIVSWNPQQVNITSCSGFRNYNWIPQL